MQEPGQTYMTKSGKPVPVRVTSASEAATMHSVWAQSAESRHEKGALIKGMFDGNPPFSRDKRRQAGNDWMANFNSLEAASRKDSAKVPYYDLISSNRTLFTVSTDKDNEKGLDAGEASREMTRIFDETLKKWSHLDTAIWTMLDDFIVFNKGFFCWMHEKSWRSH